MRSNGLRALRPYICSECRLKLSQTAITSRGFSTSGARRSEDQQTKQARQRIAELGGEKKLAQYYPRTKTLEASKTPIVDVQDFRDRHVLDYEPLSVQAQRSGGLSKEVYTVYGRVTSRRNAGGKLTFIKLESRGRSIQAILNASSISVTADGFPTWDMREERRNIRRGDWIGRPAVTGKFCYSETNEPSIVVEEKPQTLSPSLQHLPESIEDQEFLNHNRHVERILNDTALTPIKIRHQLTRAMRVYFDERRFTEVTTPLLQGLAGGATARPFVTKATEFSDDELQLRVAPELFLKRLILSGLDKVYEIGPAFRNEGIDATHNPEFYICEFYQTMASLGDLIQMTEELLRSMWKAVALVYLDDEIGVSRSRTNNELEFSTDEVELFKQLDQAGESTTSRRSGIPAPDRQLLIESPHRIDFISGMEDAAQAHSPGWKFPNLSNEDTALQKLQMLLKTVQGAKGLPASTDDTTTSLPTILDKLSGLLLESQSSGPTWIINHPECMSPLAKSIAFDYGSLSAGVHRISLRAELFINGREYVNCYEEENSPVEQRRKFVEQRRYQLQDKGKTVAEADDDELAIDENYIKALEWGLPPTGGWGCGLDRLVMLFSGRERIADVLSFGNLANVVGLASKGPTHDRKKKKTN